MQKRGNMQIQIMKNGIQRNGTKKDQKERQEQKKEKHEYYRRNNKGRESLKERFKRRLALAKQQMSFLKDKQEEA